MLQADDRQYLQVWDSFKEQFIRYDVPPEIDEIKDIYSSDDLFSDDKKLFITATLKSDGKLYSFKADLDDCILERQHTLGRWGQEFVNEWNFIGDLAYSYLAGWTDNVILVYADDGGFSGYHFDSYLYGLDRKTGKKLWPYYLSHKGMSFYCIIENHLFYRWFSIMQQWPVLLLRKTGHFKFAWQRIRLDSQDRSFNWGKNLFCFYVF